MKYYCKNCGIVLEISGREMMKRYGGYGNMRCPCRHFDFEPIPDYETPEQYEKRTGTAYPDNGLVWVRFREKVEGDFGEKKISRKTVKWYWAVYFWSDTKAWRKSNHIVIADPPVPPPDDRSPNICPDKPSLRIRHSMVNEEVCGSAMEPDAHRGQQ